MNCKKVFSWDIGSCLHFSTGILPVRVAETNTNATEQIWKEVVAEYGLKKEETELLYQI